MAKPKVGAKARAKQQLDKGEISRGQYDHVVRKENRRAQDEDLDAYMTQTYGESDD